MGFLDVLKRLVRGPGTGIPRPAPQSGDPMLKDLRPAAHVRADDLALREHSAAPSVRMKEAPEVPSGVASRDVGVREHAMAGRRQVLAAIGSAGVRMSRISEAVYRHPSGSRVAMPFSKELDGVWWLGSYEGRFDEVILLCETDGRVVPFHLPPKLVAKHLADLSRSGGRVIFHVSRLARGFALRVRAGVVVPLSPFDPVAEAGVLGGDATTREALTSTADQPTARRGRTPTKSTSGRSADKPRTPTSRPETSGSPSASRRAAAPRVEPPLALPADLTELLRRPPRFERARKGRRPDLESTPNEGYRLLETLRDNVGGMLLLTATPMQLHDYELYSMIELVEPGLFNGYADFAASRSDIAAINRAVSTLRSARPTKKAIDECLDVLREYDASVELLEAATRGKFEREIAAVWLTRCHRLSQALVRNRKVEVGGFTRRKAHRIEVTPSDAEIELERDVQRYIRERFAAAAGGRQTAVGLVLVAFQKMLCSSTRALAGALESRAARLSREVDEIEQSLSDDPDLAEEHRKLLELPSANALLEVDTLTKLARRARQIEDTKLLALEELVDSILSRNQTEQVLIFSQYLGSIEMIRSRLAQRYSVGVFHGQMSREDKDRAHQAFRVGGQVLISSEAGGEGRNFQFCHVVVNYDLPWNPMKIEQRIGRVDRIGQERDVEIYNFAVQGMLDERILNVLEHRIAIFTETVGALDPILESLEEEIGRITLGEKGDADVAFRRLDAELDAEIRKARDLEELRRDFVLDWRSLQRERANRMLNREPRATREDLEHFCRSAIGRFKGTGAIQPHDDGGLFIRVPGIIRRDGRDVDEDYRGSFDLPEALRDERMHFFAMGHPLVEAIINNVGDPWWLPVSALESPDVSVNRPALLVDYRVELYGIRDSGVLVSHLVTDDGVSAPVRVVQPDDPMLEVRLPSWPPQQVARYSEVSLEAVRLEAVRIFEDFKQDHAALVEQELDRLTRMFDSRRGFIDDRIARNDNEIERLERFGTESQKRIIPARQGQIDADRKRLAEIEQERRDRVDAVQTMIPSFHLRLLGLAMIVPVGHLKKLAA